VTLELRPPVLEDAAAIADALNEFNRPAGFDLDSADEVTVWLEFPSFDLEQDVRVAVEGGKIVGYAEAVQLPDDTKLVFADVRAGPEHGDASAALLDFVERRARELAAPGGRLRIWTAERADAWRQFLESNGFEVQRYSLRMVADLEAEPPEPAWPEGISVRTRERVQDDRAAYDLQRETFADQGGGYVSEPFEDWLHWVKREPFDPGLWFLAFAGDELVGISLCRGDWAGDDELGWVSVLGVRRSWRKKGLGSALLLHSFRELRARGDKRVGLGVRADNATGAVRVYERVGMRIEGRQVWYEKAGL
jgi:mycothiol synthase